MTFSETEYQEPERHHRSGFFSVHRLFSESPSDVKGIITDSTQNHYMIRIRNQKGCVSVSRILIVDDELRVRDLIKKYAKFEGYEVSEAANGLEALELCKSHDFDLVIMDIMMPELDGLSACREIRKFSVVPVIMLSARGEEYDKIHGFEYGVDDYVVKPFSPRELMMRVAAVLKRSGAPAPEPKELYTHGGLSVDFTGRIVTVDGERVEMSPREYSLFFFLVRNRGIALSREKLINEVWGYDFFGDDRTIDTHIKQLRKILGPYARCITTLRGVGYRFEE